MSQTVLPEVWSNDHWTRSNPGGNCDNNGYPSRIPTILPPPLNAIVGTGVKVLGDGVIALGHGGAKCEPHIYILPYGVGADDTTFSLQVLGWRPTKFDVIGQAPLWIPVTLAAYACTLGATVGVVNSDLGTTTAFVDAITSTGGPTFITAGAAPVILDWFQISAPIDAIGMIKQPTFGFRFLELIFTTGGSATSCNALYCKG